MKECYFFDSTIGRFWIVLHEHLWHVLYRDEYLGAYSHPTQAVEDISRGHELSLSSGIDPSDLDIPHDLARWQRSQVAWPKS